MIVLEKLTKQYDGFSLDVSLRVPKGTVTGLVGKNGAGKSTTMKAILGLLTPESGSVRVFGREALSPRDKERIGVTLAESGFSRYLTLADIVRILERMYPAFDRAFFLGKAEQLGLPLKKPLGTFSTGMKAKARVLIAISHGADLLVLDEPTAGLDVLARNEILDLLRAFMAGNPERSILISSHISGDLEDLCDDLYLIHNGRVLLHERMDTLLGSYGVLNVTREQYDRMEKTYVIAARRTPFGVACLTNRKQFYLEREPGIAVENGSVDDLMRMLVSEETICADC